MTDNRKIKLLPLIGALISRDLRISLRQKQDLVNPLLFFLVVITLVPLSLGTDEQVLRPLASGMIWLAALLAMLLSIGNLFRADYQDGSLEQLLLLPQPLYFLVLAKIIAHWLVTGLPLIVLATLLASMLFLPKEGIMPLIITLLLGTPILTLIGAIGAALVLPLRSNSLLLSLLILPLYIPVLIFSTSIVETALSGLTIHAHLALLGALFMFSMVLSPLAASAVLRIHIGY